MMTSKPQRIAEKSVIKDKMKKRERISLKSGDANHLLKRIKPKQDATAEANLRKAELEKKARSR